MVKGILPEQISHRELGKHQKYKCVLDKKGFLERPVLQTITSAADDIHFIFF